MLALFPVPFGRTIPAEIHLQRHDEIHKRQTERKKDTHTDRERQTGSKTSGEIKQSVSLVTLQRIVAVRVREKGRSKSSDES